MSMTKRIEKQIISDKFVFSFYCDLCEHPVTTPALSDENKQKAWDIAKKKFNKCQRCGKWVCDTHYNEEEMTCVLCNPKKMFCSECGSEVFVGDIYCKNCGNKV